MIESPWQSRESVQPLLRPQVMVGAASPLWGYFSGAAIAGVAWWWMSQWTRAANVGAIAEAAAAPAAEVLAEPAVQPLAEVPVEPEAEAFADMEALAQMVEEPVADAADELASPTVSGESASFDTAPQEAELVAAPGVEPELTPEPPAPKARKPRVEVEAKPD